MTLNRDIVLGGLNTALHPNRMPEGASDRMLNCVLDAGDLKRRGGFAEYEDDVDGAAGPVLSVHVAHFADGDVYVVAKVGAVWYQRKVYPTAQAASSFSAITGGHTHNATDRGWTFIHDDYIHLADRAGVSKWNPDRNSGTAYKAGLPRPSQGPIPTAAAGGEKDGRYHVAWAMQNSRTREESVISSQQTGAGMPVECRTATDTGGIEISNWATLRALHTDYEWDTGQAYCTFGSTEFDPQGTVQASQEKYSFRLYRDASLAKTVSSLMGLNKADSVLDQRDHFTNAGGEPPGARFGCYDGIQAVYGDVYDGTSATLALEPVGDNNNLLLTSKLPGAEGNTIRFGMSPGATAGSEVVTVTSQKLIDVTIEAEVSTANQVIAAIQAHPQANSLISIVASEGDGTGASLLTVAAYLSGGGNAGNSLVTGRIDFSIPGQPTMVPAVVHYSMGGDAKDVEPSPWRGQIVTGLVGRLTGIAAGGGRIFAFTPTSMIELARGSMDRLVARMRHSGIGCTSGAAALSTPDAIYALSYNTATRISDGRITDIAANRIRPTLESIPAAARDDSVSGYYSAERQAWWAIAEAGATKCQSVLIFDEKNAEWSIFRPGCLGTRASKTTAMTGTDNDLTFTAERPGAVGNSVTVTIADGAIAGDEYITVSGSDVTCTVKVGTTTATQLADLWNQTGDAVELATAAVKAGDSGDGTVTALSESALTGGTGDEGMTALCELATPDSSPVMLVGTDAGRILKFPSSATDDGSAYAAHWRGYIGQSRSVREQYLTSLSLLPGDNCAGNVRIGLRAMRMGRESSRRQYGWTAHKDNQYTPEMARLGPRAGRLFQVELFTPQSATEAWVVNGLHARIDTIK